MNLRVGVVVAMLVAACGDNRIPDLGDARVVLEPASGLTTTEAGGTATFTIVLAGKPTTDVEIPLASSDTGEGTVSPASVTFTTDNWNAPQTVTVTGADDAVADGAQPYTIQTAEVITADRRFSGLDPDDVSVTNLDDETPGFIVTPTSGLETTEAGGQATFTVVLTSEPTANVTVALTSSDTGEGIVAPVALTFTAVNWNAPQTVTVTGIDDALADGAQTYTIVTEPAQSADDGYLALDPADVEVSNLDNDSPGITVAPTTGLVTTESGGEATFTVVLNSQPTADVTIPLSSSYTTEGTIAIASVTFTSTNWSAPQTVTVTGVDDAIADGNQVYSIVTGAATSTDAGYAGIDGADVSLSNTDDDSPGVTVAGGPLQTTEAGGQDTFTIVLNSQPTADVTFTIMSSDAGEGLADVTTVTFTAVNWNAPRVVTVSGVDDALADGNQPYTILIGPGASTDAGYAGVDPTDVAAVNLDNDSAGVLVTPTSGLVTTEAGGDDTFTIVLTSQPTADVTIALSSSDSGEGTVSPASVTFTAANWNAPQTVTVTGVDDAVADGTQPYQVVTAAATSADTGYAGQDPANVLVNNTDNDSAGITVTPTTGLQTTEAGGTATFTIVLNSQPTAAVTIPLQSTDTSEGTVSPASVTFTTANWNAPQTVTVQGVDDAAADGNQPYSISTLAATSADPGYAGRDAANVSLTNIDNDSAGFLVTPISGLITTEAGGQATFTIVLTSQPTANVSVDLSSNDTSEGVVAPTTVVFTPANWNAPQTVTVTGVEDVAADGPQPYTIVTSAATSSDASYSGLNPSDVAVSNTDNDSAGITVATLTSPLTTTEGGGQATFTIVLNSMPSAIVTIPLSSSDPGEGTVSPASVTFTPLNWNAPQVVTVTGVDDALADGNQTYTIVTGAASSTDPGYTARDAANVSVINVDNDSAGFLVVPTVGLTTTEAGGQATFTIRLTSQPTSSVTVALTSSATDEGTVSPASLTFTAANWNAPQTVTVTGIDDDIADGNAPYTIVTAAAVSADANYGGLNPSDVSVSNIDNDSAGFVVTPINGLTTTEAGGSATFTIVLTSQPTSPVTVGLTTDDASEGAVSPASVVFTALNWNAPQTVTVTGADDAIADGNQTYHVVTAAATSPDAGYNGLPVPDVTVSNTDDDTAGITVTPTAGLTTSEAGGQATFTVVLNSQPTGNVVIALTSNDLGEGTAAPATLTFTALNWSSPQTVTVTGVDDAIADGSQEYTIVLAPAVSTDLGYLAVDPADVVVSNTDDDSAGITVSPVSGLQTSEGGGQAQFSIVLTSQPTASVTIALSSSNTSEGTLNPASVTFTTANWSAPQLVTVTGVNDDIADGNQLFSIVTAPATSGDPQYAARNAADVSVTNLDNDIAGILVNPTSGLQTAEDPGGTATFNIVLQSQPTADVTIPISSSDVGEGTVAPTSVTFTMLNWNAPQTITVTGVDDPMADGNAPYQVIVGIATSADGNYNGINPPNVSVTNIDNDSPGVTITPLSGLQTTESGGTATFTVVLTSQPSADVTIGLTSSKPGEATLSTPTLTFTTANWAAEQTVTITGVNDFVADGNQTFTVVTSAASSADAGYNGLVVSDVSGTNVDDDSPGILVAPTSGLVTSENLDTAQFTIVLASQPTADVVVGVTSSDPTEGTLPFASVTFTSANWNTPQTVSITGVDDAITDGNQVYSIVTAAATSADGGYDGIDPADVLVTNTDNDIPGFTVEPTSGIFVSEFADFDTFTIVLNTAPTANVTIPIVSGDATEGTVNVTSLTFTPANWNVPQEVTVTGVNDTEADGNVTWFVLTGVASSTDPNYNGLDPANVEITTIDNDTPQVYIKARKLLRTSEGGGPSPFFRIQLTTMPSANVTCTFSSSDTTEGTIATSSVTFTPANWNTQQQVNLQGVDDAIKDGDQLYSIITAPCTSTDPNYSGLNPRDVQALNRDND